MYPIKSYTSERHHQHQNYAECCIRHIKDIMNWVLTFTSAPIIYVIIPYVCCVHPQYYCQQ